MIYDKLGKTGLQVSKICLGTMTFGEQNTESEAHEQLDYALTQGINFIDTAELYAVPPSANTQGLTEKYIGTWLKKRGKRDDLIIASKVTGPQPAFTWIRDQKNLSFSKDQINTAIELNLKRLQTDYLDLYQLHWPERKTNFFGKLGYAHDKNDTWQDNFEEVLGTLQDLVKAGKIRHIGLSNETPWALHRCLHLAETQDLPRIASVQNPYSLLNRSYEVGLAEMSIREEVSCLPYSPLAFGLLSGKYHKKQDNPDNRINQFKQMSRYNGKASWEATGRYLEIAEKYGLSLATMALAFINQQPFVTSNIIGATNMDQLKENINSINVSLSDDCIKEINAVHSEISNPAP